MKTVKIGNQEWTAENMAVTVDRDGNELELGKDYFYPDGNVNNVEKYGLLYTWEAAMRIAPEGWHLPTKDEWDELESEICMQACYAAGYDKNTALTIASVKMGWYPYNDDKVYCEFKNFVVNDKTGFNALQAGCYFNKSIYYNESGYGGIDTNAFFWSDYGANDREALYCNHTYYYNSGFFGDYRNKCDGLSVRLIRD